MARIQAVHLTIAGIVALALATLLFTLVLLATLPVASPLPLVALGAWLFAWRRTLTTLVDAAFAGMIASGGLCALLYPGSIAVLGVALCLIAWDLLRFDLRLRALTRADTRIDNSAELAQRQVSALAPIVAAGLALGILAQLLRAQFSFAVVAALGLLALILLIRALHSAAQRRRDG